jgi:hypothetical protein
MEINMTKPVVVQAKTLKIHLKVRDEFSCTVEDQSGDTLKEYEGYVPGIMPGDHYGDYVILDIDIDSGQITNWKSLTAEEMEEFINGKSEDY